MIEKYWVRHRTLSGFAGPLTVEELGAAVRARTLPADSEVRLARPGAVAEALDGHGWTPTWRLLGIEAPPSLEATVPLPAPGAPGLRLRHVCDDVRHRSAYPAARSTALVLAVILALVILMMGVVGLAAAAQERSGVTLCAALAVVAWELGGLFLGYQMFVMLADVADCHLRQQTDRAVERAGATDVRGD